MTKRLDPEEKRKRAILTRMASAGRLGDYLTTLTEVQREEADALLEKMGAAYERRTEGKVTRNGPR